MSLQYYGTEKGYISNKNQNLFGNFIKKKGLEFEEHIVKMLRNKHYFFEVNKDLENREKYDLTLEKMKEGVPIIKV